MTSGVVFTLDLEDRRSDLSAPPRFLRATEEVLAFLESRAVRGTFFVVGSLAQAHPSIVRAVAAAGHEVGLHGLEHDMLGQTGRQALPTALRTGKAVLEEITGQACRGFRAPYFSLVPDTPWAPDAILEAGFAYSSSVMPAPNPIAGYPGAPTEPFRWSNGLIELPCPVGRVGPATLPYMGGAYMRLLPGALVRRIAAREDRGGLRWIYSHPYDFDPSEPFHVMPGTTHWQSRLLWLNRRRMFDRVQTLLGDQPGAPLASFVDDVASGPDLPVLRP
jgi:polysaccharide deacetylase family protein (PEP-CTERM system associated)